MRIRTFLAFTVLFAAPLFAGHAQAPATPGIQYQLPMNYFSFQFKLQTTKTVTGPYCDVAQYFFVFDKAPDCKRPSPEYKVELTDDFDIRQLAEPDSEHTYGLTIQKGLAKEAKMTLSFGDGGTLAGYQSAVEDHKVDFALGIFKLVADAFVGRLAPPPPVQGEQSGKQTALVQRNDCVQDFDERDRELYARLGAARKTIACKIDGPWRPAYLHTSGELKAYVDRYVNDGQTAYQHFFEALDLIHEYRELMADDAKFMHPEQFPASPEIFASLLKSRADRKKEIRQAFTVTETKSVDTAPEVVWHPSSTGGSVELLAYRPDSDDPVCFHSQPVDSGVWRSRVAGSEDCPADGVNVINASLTKIPRAPSSAGDAGYDDNAQGLTYRIPGKGTLRVWIHLPKEPAGAASTKDFDLFRKTYDVAQFGVVAHLPPELGSSSSYDVTLDSLTGALRTITLGSKGPINSDLLKQAGDLNTSILAAVNAAKKPTTLEAAQKERDLKAEQLQIKFIDACNSDPTQAYCASILPTLFK